MKFLIWSIIVLVGITLSYCAPQNNFQYNTTTLDDDFFRNDEIAEAGNKPGLWSKFKNGTKNFYYRCIKLNFTVPQNVEENNINGTTDDNSTVMPGLIERSIENRETCWQYLKKQGRKIKSKILGSSSDNSEQYGYESTTEKQSWGEWFRSFLPGYGADHTDLLDSDELEDSVESTYERSSSFKNKLF